MSTASAQLRAALRDYVEWLDDVENNDQYGAHIERFSDMCDLYGRERVRRMCARYRSPVTILVRNCITYRRV